MKDFLTSLAAKLAGWIIIAVGAIFSAAIAVGTLKEDYANVKKRLGTVETTQSADHEKINDIWRNVEYLRGRFDNNYKIRGEHGE